MGNRAKQKRQELEVFQQFAAVCTLLRHTPIRLDQPNTDPPDIMCQLKPGDRLAFEIVSCEDEIGKDKHGHGISWIKPINDKAKIEKLLNEEYRAANATGEVDQPERFESCTIRVELDAAASFNEWANAVPRAIELLNQLGVGQHYTLNAKPIRSIWCMPWQKEQPSCNEPRFSVDSSAFHVGVSVLEHIETKIKESNDYKFNETVHLLAWSSTASKKELGFWRDQLVNSLQSNGMGKFERIWVFGLAENSIVFDSADIPA